jgi:hypothetical protein
MRGVFNMKRNIAFQAISGLCLALFICSTGWAQDVRYNFDKETDFSKFKTYKWIEIKSTQILTDLVDKQVKSGIDAELAKKGLVKSDSDSADLYVGYQAAVNQEKEFSSYSSGYATGGGWYRGGWYRGGGGMATTTGQTTTIYVGQLVLDVYASAPKTLVWRGVVSKTIDQKAKPDKQQKNLTKALAKLLKNYPPPVKK